MAELTADEQFNIPYSTVLADLQKLASAISGGDCSKAHGLDCTTIIGHYWEKQSKRIAELESKPVTKPVKITAEQIEKLEKEAWEKPVGDFFNELMARADEFVEVDDSTENSTPKLLRLAAVNIRQRYHLMLRALANLDMLTSSYEALLQEFEEGEPPPAKSLN